MTLCVYALVKPSPARLALRGMAGERLHAITISGLTALVGELRRAPAPTRKNLERYASTIDTLMRVTPALLPARFGTCIADRDELAVVIRSRAVALGQRLRAVRNRLQMTIRLFESDSRDEKPCARRDAARGRRRAGKGTEGAEYLRRRAAEDPRSRTIRGFEPVRHAVRHLVRDERVDRRNGIVTINHLIPKSSADRYRTSVQQAADATGLRLVITGPWPPFAFADNW